VRLVDLLQCPREVALACCAGARLRDTVRLCLLTIAAGGLVFGATAGTFRGGVQVPIAALKIPAVTLATLAVAGPALYGIAAAFGRRWPLRTALGLLTCAGARASLVLAALAPPLWLAIGWGFSHDAIKLLAALAYGAAGLSGLSLLLHGLGEGEGRRGAAAAFVAVFLVVGAQTAWIARPYLGDPSEAEVPIFVPGRLEGGLWGALWGT
jgi:hypothetical protein